AVDDERCCLRSGEPAMPRFHRVTGITRCARFPEARRAHVIGPGDLQARDVVARYLGEGGVSAATGVMLIRWPVPGADGAARGEQSYHRHRAHVLPSQHNWPSRWQFRYDILYDNDA